MVSTKPWELHSLNGIPVTMNVKSDGVPDPPVYEPVDR